MLSDERAHFLALVGRRRVGKTFLFRQIFHEHKRFEMAGLKDADLHTQLGNFTLQMRLFFDAELDVPNNWLVGFNVKPADRSQQNLQHLLFGISPSYLPIFPIF